jgi:V/A-type H+-transporting ATPase subunit C
MAAQGIDAYALLHATVRALRPELLSPDVWTALIQAESYDAVLDTLDKTVYGPYLDIPGGRARLTPRRLIYQLRWHLSDMYVKLIGLAPEPGRQLLVELWHHYEVDNIKAVLRGIETGASWEQILFLLEPMGKHTALTLADLEAMGRSGDIAQAIERTRRTPYYHTLSHAMERYRTEQNLFPLEVALDLDYRRRLWEKIHKMKGRDHEQALRTVGNELDVDNLLWAIRYRVYHHLSSQEIINYTLPMGYRVKDEDIRAIATGSDITRVVNKIYPDLEGLDDFYTDPESHIGELEHALRRSIVDACRHAFVGYPFHIGIPLAYLWLNEYELNDLTILVEAKASDLAPETFLPMLNMLPAPGRLEQR